MPFAGYANFAACVRSNRDKRNPQAYCGHIMHQVEGKSHEYHVMVDNEMKNYGETDMSDRTIKINTERGDVVNTIIHERLHAQNPNMSEDDVYKTAGIIESGMGMKEMGDLLHETARETQKRKTIQTIASKVIHTNQK